MKYWWVVLLSSFSLCSAAESEEESLFLRRIADFWQEGEYQIAKTQMEQFINQYPQNPFSDALCAALGDLFLREKNFSSALNYYAQIQAPELTHRVFLSRMQCLYEMQWYATLADECEAYLEKNGPDLHLRYFLAVALYHQCIQNSKQSDLFQKIAQRAKPHFEMLYQTEFKEQIAQGYAHLCCILKECEKAAEIYLDLAEKDLENQEEMLFQAALIQSEFNQNLAFETFGKIADLGKEKAKEAHYNQLVLAFDLGHFDLLTQENFLEKIPPDRIDSMRLFIGKSFLNLKKYEEAIRELKTYIQSSPISESLHAALLSLSEASFRCSDLTSLDEAIYKLQQNYPNDPELPKAIFSKAQIIKQKADAEEARILIENLLEQFPKMEQKPQVLFELIHLNYKEKSWENCYEKSRLFLTEYESHQLAPFVWKYFITASFEIGNSSPAHRQTLLNDLETFLKLPLSEEEKTKWQLLLAQTYYELQDYESAHSLLKDQKTPNAKLLLALCLKDGQKNLDQFCKLSEEAIEQGADLVSKAQMHISLYNAYLELGNTEKSANHLFSAFMEKAEIKTENLLWLSDFYFDQLREENFETVNSRLVIADRTAALLNECKTALHDEIFNYKLAKIYSILGRVDDAIEQLKSLDSLNEEALLLLAESYAKKSEVKKAIQMFDEIVLSSGTVRTPIAAAASFQGAKLKLESKAFNIDEITKQLKDLIIQKNLKTEPFHLEAALTYIDLQAKNDLEKRLFLLKKTKNDFENEEDLLSKDYHEARKIFPQKEQIYQSYMEFIDAEIFATLALLEPQNKDLKAKSKDLFLKIMEGAAPTCLKERVQRRLTIDET